MNERVIFDAALGIADLQARRAFVEKACGGNPALLAAVESLLTSHAAAGSFLDIPAAEQMHLEKTPGSGVQSSPEDSAAAADKTRRYQSGDAGDDETDDELQTVLGLLQPSSKPGSMGVLAHYEVLQVLGQGAFGIVLKAFDEKLQRLVAIKVMNPQMAATSPPRKRFLREARAAAAIRHENVVQVYSVDEQPLPYLVMEYIGGSTLKEKLDRCGPLETPEVLHIARQIASGLTAAQAMGLIHRDIKPGNILLEGSVAELVRVRTDGEPDRILTNSATSASATPLAIRAKISDFGLARAADDASLTRTGVISGTPMYMAPEQATGQPLDHRADLFSLGSVLYQMACGRPPFRASTTVAVLRRVVEDTPRPLQEILPEIPDWLVAIVTKLHAKKPEDRFQTAKDVADLLARCQSELQLNGKVTCVPIPHDESSRHAPRDEPNALSTPNSKPTLPNATQSSTRSTPDESSTSTPRSAHHAERDGYVDSARRGSPNPAAPADRRSPLPGESPQTKGDLRSSPSAGSGDPRTARQRTIPKARVALALAGVLLLAAVVYRIQTDQGTLVVAIDDPAVQAILEQDGLVIRDKHSDRTWTIKATESKPLPSGEYQLKLGQQLLVTDDSGAELKTDTFALKRKGEFRVRVTLEQAARVAEQKPATSDPDRRAAEWVLSIGGNISIKENGQERGIKAVGDLPLGAFELSVVNLNENQKVTDAGLAHFQGCKNLMQLDLGGAQTQVTDAGLAHFKECKKLTHLGIYAQVSDVGLAHFQDCKNLTELVLRSGLVSDAGLAHFKDCKNLTNLWLQDVPVTDAGLSYFKDCKNLTSLGLISSKVSDAGLSQ